MVELARAVRGGRASGSCWSGLLATGWLSASRLAWHCYWASSSSLLHAGSGRSGLLLPRVAVWAVCVQYVVQVLGLRVRCEVLSVLLLPLLVWEAWARRGRGGLVVGKPVPVWGLRGLRQVGLTLALDGL